MYWNEKLAETGDVNSMYNLGYIYDQGEGGIRDYAKATLWYKKAIEQGNTDCMVMLGKMHELGKGCPLIMQRLFSGI